MLPVISVFCKLFCSEKGLGEVKPLPLPLLSPNEPAEGNGAPHISQSGRDGWLMNVHREQETEPSACKGEAAPFT